MDETALCKMNSDENISSGGGLLFTSQESFSLESGNSFTTNRIGIHLMSLGIVFELSYQTSN